MTLLPLPQTLLTRDELAHEMGISVPTLDRMRYEAKRNGFPMPEVTWGRRIIRFRLADVLAWWADYEQRSDAA